MSQQSPKRQTIVQNTFLWQAVADFNCTASYDSYKPAVIRLIPPGSRVYCWLILPTSDARAHRNLQLSKSAAKYDVFRVSAPTKSGHDSTTSTLREAIRNVATLPQKPCISFGE